MESQVKQFITDLQRGSVEISEIIVRASEAGKQRTYNVRKQSSAEERHRSIDAAFMRLELSADDRPHKDELVADGWDCRRRGENDWVCNRGSETEYARGP